MADAVEALKRFRASHIPVASVATGFPSGQARKQLDRRWTINDLMLTTFLLSQQYSLKTRLAEIRLAVEDGAREIDIVINRNLALNHKWQELYEEARN